MPILAFFPAMTRYQTLQLSEPVPLAAGIVAGLHVRNDSFLNNIAGFDPKEP